MRIVTNTAALLTPEEGKKAGIEVIPVSVSLGNRSLRDYLDISPSELAERLRSGEVAGTSQPALSDVLEILEGSDEETVMLTVADGLSGEYLTALGVRKGLSYRDRIHIVNSRSLAAPLRHMAMKAAQLRDSGISAEEITSQLERMAHSTISFVIPADFEYLNRSGRISQLTAKIGGALKVVPVLTQTQDRRRVTLMTVKRSRKLAAEAILSRLKELGVGEKYMISVGYADVRDFAMQLLEHIRGVFPSAGHEIYQLAPSLITHGGPGCVVVQTVLK